MYCKEYRYRLQYFFQSFDLCLRCLTLFTQTIFLLKKTLMICKTDILSDICLIQFCCGKVELNIWVLYRIRMKRHFLIKFLLEFLLHRCGSHDFNCNLVFVFDFQTAKHFCQYLWLCVALTLIKLIHTYRRMTKLVIYKSYLTNTTLNYFWEINRN